jgi:hypothetical protein
MLTFGSLCRNFGLIVATCAALISVPAHAQTCPFDNGGSTLENDGLVLTRYALGLRGAPMVANTVFAAGDAATIESNIACPACGLNVTGGATFTTADATIISRKLAGFSGAALTNGLGLGSTTVAAVNSFLLAGCGAGSNGWVQGGNAFGAPGVLGTSDAQPMTVKSGGNAVNVLTASGAGLRVAEFGLSGANQAVNVVNGSLVNTAAAGVLGATIAGGGSGSAINTSSRNYVSGDYGTVGGGRANIAGGSNSTVPGGYGNEAAGSFSFAAGFSAQASDPGEFVLNASNSQGWNPKALGAWGGNTTNTFNVRADRGIYFQTGGNVQCTLAAGGTGWNCASDRTLKEKIVNVSPRAVLEKVASLPVSTWVIKGYEQLHMGPMAQDFRAAFGLGRDDKTINTTDAQGVALAAIQGLHQMVKARDAEIAKLKAKYDADIAAIKKKLGM